MTDDGIGFDPAAARRRTQEGMGLIGMTRRASWLGGRVDVTSQPGAGATIRISAPLGEPSRGRPNGRRTRKRVGADMTDGPSRVLLIDDHEMSRRGLEAMLSTVDWIQVVGEADGCEPGPGRRSPACNPTSSCWTSGCRAWTACACLDEIKKLEHPVAVVIVTLYNDRRYVLEAIRRGAAGYVLKEASTAEIVATIAAVADGQLAVEPGLLREALMAPAEEPSPEMAARARAESFALTPRELDVLRLLADGMTNKEIGGQLSIAEDTVKKHVQNIIWKLRAADRTQAAIVAYRAGLLDPFDA